MRYPQQASVRRPRWTIQSIFLLFVQLIAAGPALAFDTVPELRTGFSVGSKGDIGCGGASYGFSRGASVDETWCESAVGVCNHAVATAEYGVLEAAVHMTGSGGACGYRSATTSATFVDSCVIVGGEGQGQVRYHFWFDTPGVGSIKVKHGSAPEETVTPANPYTSPLTFEFGSRFELTVTLQVSVTTTGGDTTPVSLSQRAGLNGLEIISGSVGPCGVRMGGITGTQYEPFGAAAPGPVVYVDPDARPCGDGNSWADAVNDLPYALQLVQLGGLSQPVDVWVKGGRTYKPGSVLGLPSAVPVRDRSFTLPYASGCGLYGHFAGTEASAGQRDLENPAWTTVLSGDLNGDDQPGFVNRSDNSRHVVQVSGVAPFTIDGFTIRGGNADLAVDSQASDGGGGIKAVQCHLAVRDCVINDNQTIRYGGGLRFAELRNGGASLFNLELTRCRFENNSAQFGAAAAVGYGVSWSGQGTDGGRDVLKATDCQFLGTSGNGGGGLWLFGSRNSGAAYRHHLKRCEIAGHSGTGITVIGFSDPGFLFAPAQIQVDDCAVRSNGARGMVIGSPVSFARVIASEFSFNTGGGAILGDSLNLLGSWLEGNSGGSAVYSNNAAITQCVFAGNAGNGPNAASALGGVNSSITSCTVVTGSGAGAAIDVNGGTSISNCVVWLNSGAGVRPAGVANVRYSHVQGGHSGEGNSGADPLLVSTSNPKGADGVWGTCDDGLRLQPASTAIDSGSGALLAADWADMDVDLNSTEALPFDIGGQTRVQAGGLDRGAFESGPAAVHIVRNPDPAQACPLSDVYFTVQPAADRGLAYAWRRDGIPLVNGPLATGAFASGVDSPTLSLFFVSGLDSGAYDCVISGGCASAASGAGFLTVCSADYDCNLFINGDDFDAFTLAFEAGDPAADINHDTFVTGDDFDFFMDHFVSGC